VNPDRIAEAQKSLQAMVEEGSFTGKSFLDIGCGSGLFSLAVVGLGAERVHSFDYDPQSVGCGQELKRRYFPGAQHWTVEEGDVLDSA
jgi:2-polyprenyl-6-hydroxyphenyl methylase/3-demethylubiquinone-9 3-methyltransferase